MINPVRVQTADAKTIDEFQTDSQEIANTHPNQVLIVAMHHPIYSYGIHGGDYPLKEHIFPFTALKPKSIYSFACSRIYISSDHGVYLEAFRIFHIHFIRNMAGTVFGSN